MDRSLQPPLKPIEEFAFPVPCKHRLTNGIPLYVLKAGLEEVVRLDVLVRGGQWNEQVPLQAVFANTMLREGTESLSASAIARKIDEHGAWIEFSTASSCNFITLYCLKKHFGELLPLLYDMLTSPLYPQRQLSLLAKNQKARFLVNNHRVKTLASREMNRLLFGEEHPAGRPKRAQDYDNLKREDLVEYYKKYYRTSNMTLYLSGFADKECVDAVNRVLGEPGWGEGDSFDMQPFLPKPCSEPAQRSCITLQGALQSSVTMGRWVMAPDHPDYEAFRFLAILFGGYFGSRLMMNIREAKGYTYGIWSGIVPFMGTSQFLISCEADNRYVEPLIEEIYKEMERMVTEPVPQEELEMVRNYAMGEFLRDFDGPLSAADVYTMMQSTGKDEASLYRYFETIKKMNADRLMELSKRYLQPAQMQVVIAGR